MFFSLLFIWHIRDRVYFLITSLYDISSCADSDTETDTHPSFLFIFLKNLKARVSECPNEAIRAWKHILAATQIQNDTRNCKQRVNWPGHAFLN